MLSETLEKISSFNEVAVLENAILELIRKRRTAMVKERQKSGGQVGYVQRQKLNGKLIEQRFNGILKDVKGDYGYVEVVSPMKWAGRLVQIDMALLREPYKIVETVQTELTDGRDDADESGPVPDDSGFPVPLG